MTSQYLLVSCMIFKTSIKKFKRHRDYGFFDQDIRFSKLSALGAHFTTFLQYI